MSEKEVTADPNSKENKAIRASQSKAGEKKNGIVFLSERKEYEIIQDSKHLRKGEKVKLNAATYEVFKAKGLVK
jgi:hypothetical protein